MKGSRMRAWCAHAAVNFGTALSCLWYAVLPPWWTGHDADTVRSLGKRGVVSSFIEGIRG